MTDNTEKEQIRTAIKDWLRNFNSKNADDFFKLFHPEIIYANDGAPLMRGIDGIRPWYKEAWQHIDGRALYIEEAIIIEGNMAFAVGKFYFEPSDKEGPKGETGRVILIYRRNANGDWLLAFDMDNRPPDVLPEEFAGAGEEAFLESNQ